MPLSVVDIINPKAIKRVPACLSSLGNGPVSKWRLPVVNTDDSSFEYCEDRYTKIMPVKKKVKGKKKGKKGGSKPQTPDGPYDPHKPDYVPPPPKPGEKLLKLLMSHPVDEKEVHGIKVSSRVLEQLTAQEVRDLRVVFEIFDTNNSGFIGPLELKKAMRVLGFKITREEARRMIMDISLKGRSKIDFNEFLEAVIDRQGDNRDVYEEILKGFQMFDTDGKGSISEDNLRQACREVGIKFTQKELQEMIEEADVNGDGLIDKEEFIRIMLQTNLF